MNEAWQEVNTVSQRVECSVMIIMKSNCKKKKLTKKKRVHRFKSKNNHNQAGSSLVIFVFTTLIHQLYCKLVDFLKNDSHFTQRKRGVKFKKATCMITGASSYTCSYKSSRLQKHLKEFRISWLYSFIVQLQLTASQYCYTKCKQCH